MAKREKRSADPESLSESGAEPIKDLREWITRVESMGELVRVKQPVDCNEEMSAIAYLVAKQSPSPAILFERTKSYETSPIGATLLWNILGPSLRRIALTLEESPDTLTVELIRRVKEKLKQRKPPREVARNQAPFYENSRTGNEVDLLELPIPKHWPLDGGHYAGTADAVITRDPDSGYLNVGTYRMMLQGKNQVGLYLSPGKDARLHITRAWQKDQPIQVAAAWGIDPLFMVIGSQTFPKNVSEYEFAGGIKGRPIPVVRGMTTDLLLPASAEFVVEGVIRPNSVKKEGPFGEFPGYYGRPEAGCPLVEVTAVHYRSSPILTNALMADYPSNEQSGFFSIIRSARIWDDLEKLGIPGIQGVYSHPAAAGGFGMTVLSLEQRYAGHAAQALALAAQVPGGAYYTKWIIAVDEDVDPTDINQVIWAMSSRCNPVDDIDLLRNTWSTWLDPTQNPPEKRPYGSKALINACKEHRYLPVFSKRTTLRREIYDQVASRWRELGLPGEIPTVRAFEEETKVVYHEVGGFEPGHQPGEEDKAKDKE
ncbi:MAG: UbiD-type (de) carboxylyase-like protein [Deltaproteobacteria bacterium GWA2_57_13]|nr:MAG: UbiD-type (de) carboxylyase-like protein [Deltaproteobacteria bacterium GWA2_57_13]OGQ50449.1 MAG: UbiD-type (de) carboxylyase-like protein [Deltaproteobacteria bacterium RIFCSPLOWO2_02_FULL_57_26]OGQ77134.1 MAG: UbiD-type (de) carboxylyase-like protein [Deltaproteobacteria bacterium RIFCSPLOWO2_12_FULL_57_22]